LRIFHYRYPLQHRRHYGLEPQPVKVCEPYQMLRLVEDDLKAAFGVDTTAIFPNRTFFGFVNENWREYRTRWGQVVLVSEQFKTTMKNGDTYIFPPGGHIFATMHISAVSGDSNDRGAIPPSGRSARLNRRRIPVCEYGREAKPAAKIADRSPFII